MCGQSSTREPSGLTGCTVLLGREPATGPGTFPPDGAVGEPGGGNDRGVHAGFDSAAAARCQRRGCLSRGGRRHGPDASRWSPPVRGATTVVPADLVLGTPDGGAAVLGDFVTEGYLVVQLVRYFGCLPCQEWLIGLDRAAGVLAVAGLVGRP